MAWEARWGLKPPLSRRAKLSLIKVGMASEARWRVEINSYVEVLYGLISLLLKLRY